MSESGVATPPESVADIATSVASKLTIPSPGGHYIISCRKSGRALTLLEGGMCLKPQTGEGSVLWACTDTDGYLGFKNPVSGCWFGRDDDDTLRCTVRHHKGWEFFTLRHEPDGGYTMRSMKDKEYYVLHFLGVKKVNGKEKLALFRKEDEGEVIVWEFRKVEKSGAVLYG